MVLGDAGRAPVMLAIPLLHEAGLLSFPLLLVCVFALGCFFAPYFSSQRLILPELVGDDEATVAQANAVVEGTQRATALLGPALAGILIAVIGAANVLYVDAASYFISFLILVTLVPRRPPVPQSDDSRGLLAGIRFLFRDRLLRLLSVTPAGAVVAVLFTSAIFGPLVNAPLIGVLTMRTPEALRPKVMTGVLTMALLAGPIGLVIVGPLLASWGPRPVLLFVALGQFLATLPFAFFALRRGRQEAPVTLEAA